MAENAGIFHSRIELGDDTWLWQATTPGNATLIDVATGDTLARVRAHVISMARHDLLIEHNIGAPRFRLRATAAHGSVFTIQQNGLTVTRLKATCEGREYNVNRSNPFRRGRTISSATGTHLRTSANLNGDLTVSAAPNAAPIVFFDAVFLTYGCFLIDALAETRI